MSRFNISYTITAIDKFTETADRLKQQLSGVRAALSKTAEKVTVDTGIIDERLRSMGHQLRAPIEAPRINFSPAKNSIERFNVWASNFAFRGFINSMNIIMPLMLAFHKPFKDLIAQQKAAATFQTSHLNVAALKAQANKLANVSTFSVADIMGSQAILAAKDANQQNVEKLTQVAINLAAKTPNMTVSQAAQQINNAVFARGKVSTAGDLVVTGATEAQRIQSVMSQATAKLGLKTNQAAVNQAKTTTGQLKQAVNRLSESMTTILKVAAPAFDEMAKAINQASKAVTNFVTHHKHLTKIILEGALAVLGLVAAQVLLGAAFTGIGLLLKPLSLGFRALKYVLLGTGIEQKGFQGILKNLPTIIGFVQHWLKKIIVDWGWYGVKLVAAKIKTVALKTATLAFRGAMLALRGAMFLVNDVIAGFNVLLDANPIGLAVIGIAALIAAIYELIKHWETVKRVFFEVCQAISKFIHEYILDPIKEVFHYIAKYIDPAIDKIGELAHGIANVVKHPITAVEHSVATVAHTITHSLGQTLGMHHTKVMPFYGEQAMMFGAGQPLNVQHTTNVHLYQDGNRSSPSRTYTAHNNQSLHANVGLTNLAHHQAIHLNGD